MSGEKILIVSDSLEGPTGFANNAAGIAWSLAKEYDVHILGLQSIRDNYIDLNIEGETRRVTQHANIPREPNARWDFGRRSLPVLLDRLEPDLLFTLNDIQMIQHIPQILCPDRISLKIIDLPAREFLSDDAIKMQLEAEVEKFKERYPRDTPWLAYCPHDGIPPMGDWKFIYRMADQVIAMSKFGQKVFKDYFNMDVPYIYHGVDSALFMPREKPEKLQDKFIVGDINRNQPRKQPVRVIQAFAKFAKDKDDVYLHLQKDWRDQFGWPLEYFVNLYGIRNKVVQPRPVGLPREEVARTYNMWDVNLMTCFHPDTPVLINPSVKNISEIEAGDMVLTYDGTYKRVNEVVSYDYDGDLLAVKPTYLDEFKVTPSHFLFRLTRNIFKHSYHKHKAREKPVIEEIQAKDLRPGDVMVVPRIKEERPIEESRALMRLYGLFLSEGCIVQRKTKERVEGIIFSISTKESKLTKFILDTMKKEFGINGIVKDLPRHRRLIKFYSAKIGRLFKEMFGDSSHTKIIPNRIMKAENEKLKYLIKGLWEGDGYIEERDGKSTKYELQTVSKTLAYQIWQILIKLGYIASLHKSERQSTVYRIGVSGQQEFGKILGHDEKHTKRKTSIGWIDENFFYVPIRSMRREHYKGKVYDLNIDTNHNYCSPLLGHNTGGEGFGIPFIEAGISAVPSIGCDYTTTRELLVDGKPSPRGLMVKYSLHWQLLSVAAVQRSLVDINDLVKALNKYYYNKELMKKHGENAHEWCKRNVTLRDLQHEWIKTVKKVLNR